MLFLSFLSFSPSGRISPRLFRCTGAWLSSHAPPLFKKLPPLFPTGFFLLTRPQQRLGDGDQGLFNESGQPFFTVPVDLPQPPFFSFFFETNEFFPSPCPEKLY